MDSSDDRKVLLELFRATNGLSWRIKYGWDTNASMSSWFGVTTDEDGRIATLDLSDNKLKGAIPESLGQLTNMTTLNLFVNQLTGAIPESLGKLTRMTTLNIRSNQLTDAIPESLGKLTNITTLNLEWNQLTGAIPESFGQLTNMTTLNLRSNQLTGAIPDFIRQTNMTTLDLRSNRLTGAIPESLGKLTNMTMLKLSSNQLTGAIPKSLGKLANMTTLDLSSNQLTGAIPESFGHLSNLTTLDLSSNQLTVISEEAARGLQRLRLQISSVFITYGIILGGNRWTNPPTDVIHGGLEEILGYWEAIKRSGFTLSWKLKVVLVGAVKAGKTSLANGMIHGEPRLCHENDRTKGVDVHVAEPCKPDAEQKLELVFWDFAGHPEYYSTHQVFLSKGALHLLVVDLKRFTDEPSLRGELVDVWLDALQCRVPGSSVLVVATQIDKFTGHLEAALGNLRRIVEAHPSIKDNELELRWHDTSTPSDAQQKLIFHGVETVSSTCSDDLMDLRSKLSKLVYSKRNMFPSVGRRRPVSWGRVCAMLDAKRSGKDPALQASAIDKDQGYLEAITTGVKFLHRKDALDDWRRLVRTLKLEREVGSTLWDMTVRKFTRRGNTTRRGKKAVFEDAVAQLVREGTILDAGEVLYLEPTWINDLLRAILDHDLADVMKEYFWEDKLKRFCDWNSKMYYDLKNVHDNFPSTGVLTVRYLRFLWRDVSETHDEELFESLLGTMSSFGVVFQGNPSGANLEHAVKDLHDGTELFVPLHLPSNILESDLEEMQTLLDHQYRKELVYEIHQPYVPPGILGLLMAQFLPCESVKFRKCWSRGAIFSLGEVLVMLYLDTPSHDKTEIRANLFGERYVSDLETAMKTVEDKVTSMVFERFDGLILSLKQGYPREVDSVRATGGITGGGLAMGNTNVDVLNAVVAKIDGLGAHLDKEMSLLQRGLRQLEENLHDEAKSLHSTLLRLNTLQFEEVPYPRLVIIRPAAAMVPVGGKRSLRAMVKSLGRRTKKLVYKDMRLCFLCPYDFSEVACGLNGNGYPITTAREWVVKIRPALKVTAVLAKVAIKTACGVDISVSDLLNFSKVYLGEELADHVLDDRVVERAFNGRAVPGEEGQVKTLVGEAYEELKKFMKEQKRKTTGGYVHFDELMQLVDDGKGSKVWVSNENVDLWKSFC